MIGVEDVRRRRRRIAISAMRVSWERRCRLEVRRVDIIAERHLVHHIWWVGHVTTRGSHVLTVHLRVMNFWEATAVVVAVVVAITVAVLAVVVVAVVEVSTARREVPVIGPGAREGLTLSGALEKGAAVHVEKVEIVLVVFLEVLEVRCENGGRVVEEGREERERKRGKEGRRNRRGEERRKGERGREAERQHRPKANKQSQRQQRV
jgi:hypothetical protein